MLNIGSLGPQRTLFTLMHKAHRDERAQDECQEACRKQSKSWRARHKVVKKVPEVGTRYRRILRFAGRPLALELCVHSTGLARHLLPVPATLIHHLTQGLRPRLRALARIGSSKHFACRLRLPALTFADCQLTEGGRETDTQRRDGM